MTAKPLSYWRTPDKSTVDQGEEGDVIVAAEPESVEQDEAEGAWADAARPVLAGVAKTYQGLIMHTDLAARLQDDSGIFTRSNPSAWLDRVLSAVAATDIEQNRPPLVALVVHKVQGTVGAAYDEVLRLTGADPISDPIAREKHAAEARMECYRWADAKLPADGGHAALSPKFAMVVTRERKRAREEAVADVCPNCFMAIPPTGVCDNCA